MTNLNDDFVSPPTEAQGYLIAAQGMLYGAISLKSIEPPPAFALTLLCGHACESALKSLLAFSGITAEVLGKKPYGHDLSYLWNTAEKKGFSVKKSIPDWFVQLDSVYDRPFHLRYPLGFHAIVLPNQIEMATGTELLVSLATSIVK